MSKQRSNRRGEKSSVHKAASTRHGFEPMPAAAQVDGASGENEPTGRTAVEVQDFYTEEKMEDDADELEKVDQGA